MRNGHAKRLSALNKIHVFYGGIPVRNGGESIITPRINRSVPMFTHVYSIQSLNAVVVAVLNRADGRTRYTPVSASSCHQSIKNDPQEDRLPLHKRPGVAVSPLMPTPAVRLRQQLPPVNSSKSIRDRLAQNQIKTLVVSRSAPVFPRQGIAV
ncbi:hypothetical protein Pfl01_2423 [Pseudomonas fluorescens Pf0-1]|uniref:Uncharacterized protein n=1 Tax=Pseudomonas fluorescens (strain Pf0-1) TaxID=205922 RepID=Q3KDJ1_PSEPF|nr:hypothetical protein Pfl01_2423 [Pseudomonas fluorescens Pf0-1]